MRLLAMTIAALLLAASSFAQTTELVIQRAGSQPSNTGPADRFNFLSASLDREVTLEAMRITRRIMTAPAMEGIATDEIVQQKRWRIGRRLCIARIVSTP